MKKLTLPGIASIAVILASNFRGEMIKGKMKLYCDFEELSMVDIAEFTTTPEQVSGQTIYTTTGTWLMVDRDDVDYHYYNENYFAFLLTDVYGNKYVLGGNETPYPTLKVDKANNKSLRALTANLEYINTKSLIPVY